MFRLLLKVILAVQNAVSAKEDDRRKRRRERSRLMDEEVPRANAPSWMNGVNR